MGSGDECTGPTLAGLHLLTREHRGYACRESACLDTVPMIGNAASPNIPDHEVAAYVNIPLPQVDDTATSQRLYAGGGEALVSTPPVLLKY